MGLCNLYIWEVYKIFNLSVKINDDIYAILLCIQLLDFVNCS
jgi:hypothetical protein